jgi:hypothetical protein
MIAEMPIRKSCDVSRVLELCGMLISDRRGKTLAEEIQTEVGSGYIRGETYARLSRWAHPKRDEPNAQPVAESLSYELFGFVISRVED